ncbi:parallel beta-helix domain-containing protein [Leptospira ellisii]|uniref:Parallel beta-helix domain-containing protein n=2 Tax=Leptospira ellisii TaxID=2023197 RepID=A0AAE4TZU9_9LEPT|nr:parallel beta-helix domain-containing protein [Leptospira ellisii]MDV6237214.1 parallel beta-helix domain-containing protein [Leptospira ellisii]
MKFSGIGRYLGAVAVLISVLSVADCKKKEGDDTAMFAVLAAASDPCFGSAGPCYRFTPDVTESEISDKMNTAQYGSTFVFSPGTYSITNSLVLRERGITIKGFGKDVSVLDFTGMTIAGKGGIDVVGDGFSIRDITIRNTKGDGIRVEASTGVNIQRLKVEWTGTPSAANGAYGIYPVKSFNVLMEDCESYGASDAGIYVGQTNGAIVRRNIAKRNVAGIEIENTRNASVYDNIAEDNTGGLVIFDLNNPVSGGNIKMYNNTITSNNRANFGAGFVASIPPGTGTFVMATSDVEIFGNTYTSNKTVDLAVISAYAFDATLATQLATNAAGANPPLNPFARNVYIHNNTFIGGGTAPDGTNPGVNALGALIAGYYGAGGFNTIVDSILYDGLDNPDPTQDNAGNNTINLCVKDNTGASFADLDLKNQPDPSNMVRIAAGASLGVFGCNGTAQTGAGF